MRISGPLQSSISFPSLNHKAAPDSPRHEAESSGQSKEGCPLIRAHGKCRKNRHQDQYESNFIGKASMTMYPEIKVK